MVAAFGYFELLTWLGLMFADRTDLLKSLALLPFGMVGVLIAP
jgi:hypothetical protein